VTSEPPIPAQLQRDFALDVVRRLHAKGHVAYWAGGCVRDQLLGRVPKDYDVATSATPEEIRSLFGRRQTLAIGAAFGVIAVLAPGGLPPVEVTTFRRDAAYSDGRRPDAVTFGSAEEDAQRRDFTINGLFFDPLENQVFDFVDGQADLERNVIRAIGDAKQRIAEDKLRMLRAVRFTAAFHFALDGDTADAIRAQADKINVVSTERIAQELRGLLTLPGRRRGLELLREVHLLDVLLPEAAAMVGFPQQKPLYPADDLWQHTLRVIEFLPEPVSFTLALAALLHDVGKPKTLETIGGKPTFRDHETVGAGMAGAICRRLKLSRREESRVCWLVKQHMALGQAKQLRWAKLQRILTSDGIDELLDLHQADALATTGDTSQVEYCRTVLTQPEEELRPQPLLSGHDLIRHGVTPGALYQELLARVYDAQLEKTIHSKREALALVDRLILEQSPGDAVERPDPLPPAS
jgi:poly(A) polymerase